MATKTDTIEFTFLELELLVEFNGEAEKTFYTEAGLEQAKTSLQDAELSNDYAVGNLSRIQVSIPKNQKIDASFYIKVLAGLFENPQATKNIGNFVNV